jgi:hypothetical protein
MTMGTTCADPYRFREDVDKFSAKALQQFLESWQIGDFDHDKDLTLSGRILNGSVFQSISSP